MSPGHPRGAEGLSYVLPAAPFAASPGVAGTSVPAWNALLVRVHSEEASGLPGVNIERSCPLSAPSTPLPVCSDWWLRLVVWGSRNPLQPPLAICLGGWDSAQASWVAGGGDGRSQPGRTQPLLARSRARLSSESSGFEATRNPARSPPPLVVVLSRFQLRGGNW